MKHCTHALTAFTFLLGTTVQALAVPMKTLKSIELNASNYFEHISDHSIKIDLESPTFDITASFAEQIEEPGRQIGEPPMKSCSFKMEMTKAQSRLLSRLLKNLKVCRARGEEAYDVGFQGVILTDTANRKIIANKGHFGYPEDEQYVCKGGPALYDYIKKIVKPRVPAECPREYLTYIFEEPEICRE